VSLLISVPDNLIFAFQFVRKDINVNEHETIQFHTNYSKAFYYCSAFRNHSRVFNNEQYIVFFKAEDML
jgi:hypothetical protein